MFIISSIMFIMILIMIMIIIIIIIMMIMTIIRKWGTRQSLPWSPLKATQRWPKSDLLVNSWLDPLLRFPFSWPVNQPVYIPQRGVQWKQGVVICMTLYTSLSYDVTPIHCTPLRLHPPLMNTQPALFVSMQDTVLNHSRCCVWTSQAVNGNLGQWVQSFLEGSKGARAVVKVQERPAHMFRSPFSWPASATFCHVLLVVLLSSLLSLVVLSYV